MKRLVSVVAILVLSALSATACASLPQPSGSLSPSATAAPSTAAPSTAAPSTAAPTTSGPSTTAGPTPGQAIIPPNATADGTGIAPFKQQVKSGAPLVELFFDYQCPACGGFERTFGSELSRLAQSGDIALVYRPMVFLDVNYENDASTRAAVAATCADVPGKFDAYHKTLFALIQYGYTDAVLTTTIPGRIGLTGEDLESFQECYAGRRTLGFVRAADQLAIGAGVQSTPTIRADGKTVDLGILDANDPSSLWRAIEAAR